MCEIRVKGTSFVEVSLSKMIFFQIFTHHPRRCAIVAELKRAQAYLLLHVRLLSF